MTIDVQDSLINKTFKDRGLVSSVVCEDIDRPNIFYIAKKYEGEEKVVTNLDV